MRPVAKRFSERVSPRAPSLPTPTSSPSMSVRLMDCLCLHFRSMHAPPPATCLTRLQLTAAAFSPLRHHRQMWRWRALWPYSTAVCRHQSFAACAMVKAPVTAWSLWHDHNPIYDCSFLAQESHCMRALLLRISIALETVLPSRFFLCGKISTAPEHQFFFRAVQYVSALWTLFCEFHVFHTLTHSPLSATKCGSLSFVFTHPPED